MTPPPTALRFALVAFTGISCLLALPQSSHAQRRARVSLGITTEKIRYGRPSATPSDAYETDARGFQIGASYDVNRIGFTLPRATERTEAIGAIYAEFMNYDGDRGRIQYNALGYQVRTRAFGAFGYAGIGAGLYNVRLSDVTYIYDRATRARDGVGLGGKIFIGFEGRGSAFAQVDLNLLDVGINPGLSLVVGSRLF